MGWEERYRPQRFSEVRGQDHAVRLLSGLVRRQTGGRNLLLQGTIGSGKTTLARLLAKALNCQHVDEKGSPCQECASCLEPERSIFEYDVAGLSGDKDKVRSWVDAFNRSPTESRVRMLFLDEAQALTHPAQDSLLKVVEDAAPGVIFCFATTEARKLKPALRSRLMDIRIHALTPADAVDLLEHIARKEGVSYDRPALFLMAAAKPPYARDLIIGLEQLHGLGQRIDVELVKQVFDLGVCDHLSRYCLALADGDRSAQTGAMVEWRDGIADKVKWIERFLTATYYNDVLGQRIVIDPLVHSLDDTRREVTQRLCKRFHLDDPRDLAPRVEAMLEFWSQPRSDEEGALYLKLGLFESLVNHGFPESVGRGFDGEERVAAHPILSPFGMKSLGGEPQWEDEPAFTTSRFIERDEIQEIINRASFFTQHYGAHMNTAFRIDPDLNSNDPERSALEATKLFCADLERYCADNQSDFASVTLMERSGSTVIGRVVAHIPKPEPGGNLTALLSKWRDTWGSEEAIEARFWSKVDARNFHWDAVFDLCAGFQADADKQHADKDLRNLLQIPRALWRDPGPLDCTRLIFSPLLSATNVASVCANGMTPLSAFDAEAWDWISIGWEADEYNDRKEESDRRQRVLSELEDRWRNDPERLQQEIARRQAWWRTLKPENRPREWRGWW